MTEPKWMIHARSFLGTKEIAGSKHHREILKWFNDSGHGWIKDDETAWCAAFANAMLKHAGVKGTGSVAARSFLEWGKSLSKPVPGCIVVFSRGNKSGWQGHVAFFVSETKTQIKVLGGNQSDSVSIANYAKNRLLGYRWPVNVEAVTPVLQPVTKPIPVPEYTRDQIRRVQQRLLDHGYVQVGGIDGLVGDNTRGAVRDFRAKNELPPGDHIDAALIEALKQPDAVRPTIAPDRANATLWELRGKDSEIVKGTDWQKIGAGTVAVATTAKGINDAVTEPTPVPVETSGVGDVLTESGEQVEQVIETLSPFQNLFYLFMDWIWVPITIIAIVVGWKAFTIASARLRDHRSGNTTVVNLPKQT